MKKLKFILRLLITMLKIGLFTFGGGYAMIALLENEFIEKKKWIEKDEFLNMVAIAESTPGPIAINAATYIGYQTAGLWGALAATVAVCIPSFIIIFLISLFFDTFLSLTYVAYAFRGIQICVIYLILSAGIRMLKGLEKNVFNFGILLSVMLVMTVFSIFAVEFSTVFYILICGTVGVFFYLISKLRKGEKKI
ncbi:MAG: chromate transporter [Clostridiales bacterium]|jgi:chromate transporter|nr:chromate transporter [Clostridiales bacterium]